MRHLEARERREAVKDGVVVWRPWQLKQLELVEGRAVSLPSRQYFTLEYTLICIQSGAAHYQYRNTRVSDQVAGTLLVIEPGEPWTCRFKDCTFYSLLIDPAWLQRLATELFQREQFWPQFPSHGFFDPSLSRAVSDLAARSLAPASRLQQEETLLHLFDSLLLAHAEDAGAPPRVGREHPAVKRTKEYLQTHYAEEVPLQELAKVAHLSPFHLAHVFRQTVGVPPHAYQTQLRLAHARMLLAQGFDVGYVAHETGFFDQSHFTQQFQRYFFVTPGSYRKTARFS